MHGNTHLSLGERHRELHDVYVLYSIQYGIDEYAWPGNVRELRNAVSRRLELGDLAD